jgi:hypothetical protein
MFPPDLKANTKAYSASLLKVISADQNQHVYFDRNIVKDMAFYGTETSLIKFVGSG